MTRPLNLILDLHDIGSPDAFPAYRSWAYKFLGNQNIDYFRAYVYSGEIECIFEMMPLVHGAFRMFRQVQPAALMLVDQIMLMIRAEDKLRHSSLIHTHTYLLRDLQYQLIDFHKTIFYNRFDEVMDGLHVENSYFITHFYTTLAEINSRQIPRLTFRSDITAKLMLLKLEYMP